MRGQGERLIHAAEGAILVAVPAVMVLCVLGNVQSTAGFTLCVASLAVFFMLSSFERSQPSLRQLMPTVVLAAMAAMGRLLFAPFAYVKPVSAICMLCGATLGRRCGFACGALAALSSNVFFGQGPWTPWQMYAWGLIGYLSGVLQGLGGLNRRLPRNAFAMATGLLYGAILNSWHILGFVRPLMWQTALAAYAAGLPFDVLHGLSTVVFCQLLWGRWRASIQRVVAKYGL